MRFSMFKRFSLLHLHRRTRSESSAIPFTAPPTSVQTRSRSAEHVVELAFDTSVDAPSYILSSVLPPSHSLAFAQDDCFSVPTSGIAPGFAFRNEADSTHVSPCITALENDIIKLKQVNYNLVYEAAVAQEELAAIKEKFLLERSQSDALKRSLEQIESRTTQLETFIKRVLDLGLHEPVFDQSITGINQGMNADEALVNAIKTAATKYDSPWAELVPAITGPRTSDDYISAINMTLALRKQLKRSEKIARFWKSKAREEGFQTITPSASNIPSIYEDLSLERQTAVDDLMERLKRGDAPRRVIRKQEALCGPQNISSVVSAPSLPIIPTTMSTIQPYVPNLPPLASVSFKEELAASHSHSKGFPKNRQIKGDVGVVDSNSDTHNSSHEDGVFLRPLIKSAGKNKATALAESIDSNASTFRSAPTSGSISLQPQPAPVIRASVTNGREATVICDLVQDEYRRPEAGSQQSTRKIEPSSAPNALTLMKPDLQLTCCSALVAIQEDKEEPSLSMVDPESLCESLGAMQALLSLERICAAFNSNRSLGSLIIQGEAEHKKDNQAKVNSSASGSVVSASISEEASTLVHQDIQCLEQGSQDRNIGFNGDFSFEAESISSGNGSGDDGPQACTLSESCQTPSPVRDSRLPVLKHFRRTSFATTTPIARAQARASPIAIPVITPAISLSIKTKAPLTSPLKRMYNLPLKPTSPLVIRKKVPLASTLGPSSAKPIAYPPGGLASRIPTSAAKENQGFVIKGKRAAKALSRILS